MSNILNEPACIPHIPSLNKEAAKRGADVQQDHQEFFFALSVFVYDLARLEFGLVFLAVEG